MITNEDLTAMGYYEQEDKGVNSMTPLEMVRGYKSAAMQTTNVNMSLQLIREEFDEWLVETLNPNGSPEAELKELCDVVYVAYGYALAKGWNLDKALIRVHQNNMDRMVHDDGLIRRMENGKIIKNPNTPSVELKDLVG